MRLFTIGDSVSQGFMSGAAAQGELCYSNLIARAIEDPDYRFTEFSEKGLFVPLERIMYALEEKFGSNINLAEWPLAIAKIQSILDESEDYYERGGGSLHARYQGKLPLNNVSSYGLMVADAHQLTPKICWEAIESDQHFLGIGSDGFMSIANKGLYRSALHVLNPDRDWENYGEHSQLDWLQEHVRREGGVENVIFSLGGNNALGTILGLSIRQSPGDPDRLAGMGHKDRAREGWTLWHPDDFRADYKACIDRVDKILQSNANSAWKVFVTTIPALTIAPLAKGVGPATLIRRPTGKSFYYYKYYTYFPFEEEYAQEGGRHLTLDEALHIDDVIEEYNRVILSSVKEKNEAYESERYFIVDFAEMLSQLAVKRNGGNPTYQWPDAFRYRYPRVNTRFYHADAQGVLKQGGLVGLDGVHPTAIGQGLLAHELLKVMRAAKVRKGDGASDQKIVSPSDLDWEFLFSKDLLYSRPISMMREIYQHAELTEWFISVLECLR